MSAREISADNRKYSGQGGRGMIAERHSGNRRRIKRLISGAGERGPHQPGRDPKGLEKDRLPRGWTCTSVILKNKKKTKTYC